MRVWLGKERIPGVDYLQDKRTKAEGRERRKEKESGVIDIGILQIKRIRYLAVEFEPTSES